MKRGLLALLSVFLALPAFAQDNPSKFAGEVRAVNFAYGIAPNTPALQVDLAGGPSATGTATLTVSYGSVTLTDGTVITPLSIVAPVTVGTGANQETVTPTAVSCTTPQVYQSCSFTASFTYQHSTGDRVSSGTVGLQEALNFAFGKSGGEVVVDYGWTALAGTNALITAATVMPNVSITDRRGGGVNYWNAQGGATVMTTPTTLTSTTATDSTTPAGTWAQATYAQGVACVDILGQEGPVSATYAHAVAAGSSSISITAPTNCVGAVGYVVYSTLSGASYPLAYELPLVTQPTVVGAYPVSNGSCTLTKLETVTPACAVANTTYGQLASNFTSLAIPVNTSPIAPQTTIISTTSVYVPNPNGRTTYNYVPGSRIANAGLPTGTLAYPITAAAATVVPAVLGEINIPPGFMNYVGKTLEICGEFTTTASAATIVNVQFQWDSFGQNTAGKGVLIGNLTATPTVAIATAGQATFCEDFQTTVASASATGGSINHIGGGGAAGGVTLLAGGPFSEALAGGAVGSLNLADAARINVIYLHTTATDGAGWILQSLTAKVVN